MTIRLLGQLLVEDFSAPRRNQRSAELRSAHSSRAVESEVGMSLLQRSLAPEAYRGLIGRLSSRFGGQRSMHRPAFD